MPGAVDAAADVVDVRGNTADGSSQLFLFCVIDLDDVPVNRHFPGVSAEIAGAELIHLVANYAQFLLVQADFLADGSCTVWHIKELPSLYNGHFFAETQVSKRKNFKKYAPLLLRKRERVVSADMRFERVASTSGVRTHRKNERFSLAADTPILIFGEAPNP